MDTETGVNAQFIPVFEVIRDPLVPEVAGPGEVVQVYDLVGLQINGYLDGKPYYGNVFFDNGVKYAGVRNTGVRVYDTLQESVTGVAERVIRLRLLRQRLPQRKFKPQNKQRQLQL